MIEEPLNGIIGTRLIMVDVLSWFVGLHWGYQLLIGVALFFFWLFVWFVIRFTFLKSHRIDEGWKP